MMVSLISNSNGKRLVAPRAIHGPWSSALCAEGRWRRGVAGAHGNPWDYQGPFLGADGVGCVYMVKTYYIPDPLGPA